MPSSTKKRTAAKKPQPPATISAPAIPLPYPAPTSSPSTYTPITDDISIEQLVGLARDSPHDSALGIVWQRAFEEGKKIGYSEGAKLFEGVDISEGMETAVERGYEKGIEAGRNWEKRAWGAAGHSATCITVARPPRGVAVQTENAPPSRSVTTAAVQVDTPKTPPPLHISFQADMPWTVPFSTRDTSSQTTSQPSPIPDPMHSPPPTALNWADDAASLPISLPILPSSPPPRDFSVLRSSARKPFSSLQRRNKRSQVHFFQPFHNRQHFTSHQNLSHHRFSPSQVSSTPFRSAQVYPRCTPRFSSSSALNWDEDPRLLNLSQALKALGWIRP